LCRYSSPATVSYNICDKTWVKKKKKKIYKTKSQKIYEKNIKTLSGIGMFLFLYSENNISQSPTPSFSITQYFLPFSSKISTFLTK
jgi:hypothetical protein